MRRSRCSSSTLLLAVVALAVSAPPASAASSNGGYTDPSRALGATSPSCRFVLDPTARRSCRASGSASQPHPLDAYGIDVRAGFSLTDPGRSFLSAMGTIGAGLWMGLLYLVKGVLLMLEWSFSLDLTNEAMPEARRSLQQLHDRAFGDSWLLLAISITGIWGMWRGLVQRRAAETFAGLAATVALIVLCLVVISRPAETVGRAAQLTNAAGLGVLSAATTGRVGAPRQALTDALSAVFATTVRDPWCALEFGSVDYCDQRTGDAARPTYAEVWLAYPAQSWQRGRLHEAMKGPRHDGFDPIGSAKDLLGLSDDRQLPPDVRRLVHPAPEQARMQEAGGTFPRLALLGTITVGLLGAVALYAYLGLRLLLAAGLTLVMLLIAPAMLLAPAVGDSGRATFIAWGRRLIGALLAKLIYAVFLAVVLATSGICSRLELGWFGTWLLLGAFWWGVFLKRDEIVGFVSAGAPRGESGGLGQSLTQGYYAWMLGRTARQAAGRAVTPLRQGGAALATRRADGRRARAAAVGGLARERLDADGRRAGDAAHTQASEIVVKRGQLQRELAAVDRRLRGFDEAAAAARAADAKPPAASVEQQHLLRRRQELRSLVDDPAAREAVQAVRHADRNRALTGEAVSQTDLDVYRARRAADHRADLPIDDERHLRAAGIAPSEYSAAGTDRRERLRAQAREHLDRERALLAAGSEGAEPSAIKHARHWLDDQELRHRVAEERARLRDERRKRRARDGVFRKR